jgi:ABC-type bacteriocin/lantibiotic exporter with double-glycine peptidase domain
MLTARGLKRFALLGWVLTSSCYLGTARNTTPGELARESGWEVVEAVPDVRQVARVDCGAAALTMVLRYWGFPVARDEVSAASRHEPDQGIQATDLREFARRQGLQAFLIRGQQGDLEREIHRRHPVLVGVMKRYIFRNYPHYEVVVGINRQQQRILTLDPAHGLRVNGRSGFTTEWTKAGQATLVVFPQAPILQVAQETSTRAIAR